jgi:hypothetical protein
MKKLLPAFAVIAILVGCSSVPKGGAKPVPPAAPPAQAAATTATQAATAATPAGDSFTGTIVGYRMGGSMARPYVRAKIKGDDGQAVEFNLRKTTAVTDVDGKTIGFTHGYKNGRRVEIKFTVTNGLNEAVSWHYLD